MIPEKFWKSTRIFLWFESLKLWFMLFGTTFSKHLVKSEYPAPSEHH
jgi:hypothetical protein